MSAKAQAKENPLPAQLVHEKGCKYADYQAAVIVSTDESDTTSTAEDGDDDDPNPNKPGKDCPALAAVVFSDDDDSSSTLDAQEVGGSRRKTRKIQKPQKPKMPQKTQKPKMPQKTQKTQKTQRRDSKPAAGPVAAVVLSTDDSDSSHDVKDVRSPDDSMVSANPETMESLSAFNSVRGLRVRILNLAATRYEISAEASDTPFLKAQFRCPPPKGCCGGGGGGHKEGSSGGPFTIDISDFCSATDTTLVRVSCSSTGSVMVESPEAVVIGYVAAHRILCGINFIIRDIFGTARMIVKGPNFCRSKCQQNEVFEVLRPYQTVEAAKLNRPNGANEYTLTMPESMTADMKAALLCASLLFDRKMFA